MSDESYRTPQEIWAASEMETLRARIRRLESVLETTRALSDMRARELEVAHARLKVIEEYFRPPNLG